MSKQINFNVNEYVMVQDVRKIEVDRTVFPTVKGVAGGNISRAKMKAETLKGHTYAIPCEFTMYDGSKYTDELILTRIFSDPDKNRDLAMVYSKTMGQFTLIFSSLLSGSFKKEFSRVYRDKAEQHNLYHKAWKEQQTEALSEKAMKDYFKGQRDDVKQHTQNLQEQLIQANTLAQQVEDDMKNVCKLMGSWVGRGLSLAEALIKLDNLPKYKKYKDLLIEFYENYSK